MLTPPSHSHVTVKKTGDSYWAATIFSFKKCRDRSTPLSLVILASEVMIWSIRWIMSLWISSRNLAGFPPDDVAIVAGGRVVPKELIHLWGFNTSRTVRLGVWVVSGRRFFFGGMFFVWVWSFFYGVNSLDPTIITGQKSTNMEETKTGSRYISTNVQDHPLLKYCKLIGSLFLVKGKRFGSTMCPRFGVQKFSHPEDEHRVWRRTGFWVMFV